MREAMENLESDIDTFEERGGQEELAKVATNAKRSRQSGS